MDNSHGFCLSSFTNTLTIWLFDATRLMSTSCLFHISQMPPENPLASSIIIFVIPVLQSLDIYSRLWTRVSSRPTMDGLRDCVISGKYSKVPRSPALRQFNNRILLIIMIESLGWRNSLPPSSVHHRWRLCVVLLVSVWSYVSLRPQWRLGLGIPDPSPSIVGLLLQYYFLVPTSQLGFFGLSPPEINLSFHFGSPW